MARSKLTKAESTAIFSAAVLVAVGGIIYELILGTAASYLIGDSILSFSLATGITLFGMGIGSLIAPRIKISAATSFAINEILLGVIGGNSVLMLYSAFSFTKISWLVFAIISLIVGIFIGLEIPLLVKMFESFGRKSSVSLLSKILALDYFGALLASLVFPLILLPYLGLMRTAYLVAFLNVLVAVLILYSMKVSKKILIISGIAILMLGALFSGANWLEKQIDSKAYKDPVILYEHSAYQKIVLTKFKNDIRLFLNNQLQFSSLDEARYHETLSGAAMTSVKNPKKVAIFGGGDGMLAREVLKYSSVEKITLVDLDPFVTDLAKKSPEIARLNKNSLSNPKVEIINQDAFKFAFETNNKFDAILIDLVDPSNEKLAKLYSQQFYAQIPKILSSKGVFITQATSSYFSPNAFASVFNTIKSSNSSREVVAFQTNIPSFGEWGFVLSAPNSNAILSQKLPQELAYQNQERLSYTIKKSVSNLLKTEISTLLTPKIVQYYEKDMKQWRYY